MGLLLGIVFGAIVGWIASVVMKTDYSHGLLTDIILGIIGSVVGGWIFNFFGQPGITGFNIYSILVGVVGSVVVIYLGRVLRF